MPAQWPSNQTQKQAREINGGFESAIEAVNPPPSGDLQYIFSDDFSSGDLSKTENGFTWGGGFRVDPSTLNPRSGTHSLKVRYQAESERDPPDGDTSAERSFNLGALYSTVVLKFDIYIPDGTEPWGGARYTHRDPGPSNNKLFRLWGDNLGSPNTYSTSREKIGASTWPQYDGYPNVSDESRMRPEWSPPGSGAIGGKGDYVPLYELSDFGNWMTLRFEMKMPSRVFANEVDSDGYFKMEKNGTLIFDRPMNNYEDAAGYNHAYQAGYIMGWANSGFAEETILFLDNFEFWGVPK